MRHGLISEDIQSDLEFVRLNVTIMPRLSTAAKLRLDEMLRILHHDPCLPENAAHLSHLLEAIQGALSCPISIAAPSPTDISVATVLRDLTLQVQATRRNLTPYERYLASSRAAKLLAIGLEHPSLEVLNALFMIDGQLMYTWMVSAEAEPCFAELVDCVYQAVKIWGWSILVSIGVWSAFRRWQWSTLWKPLARLILNQ
jgi:hypothetical protein